VNDLVCCVDFGSTFTKAALVDVNEGLLLAEADHPTTLDTDVLDGWEACRARLSHTCAAATDARVLACSSAGGGLRIGVLGNEELVTAEAGRRVALSSGGRVVLVGSGVLSPGGLAALHDAKPDVVLLVGGTDGGNADVLLACARTLATSGWTRPVVVAGNVDGQADIAALFEAAHLPFVMTDNVVPRIGQLRPEPARAAIREMFLRHVIGGKHLSRRSDFLAMVQGATPDVVLTAVELLATGLNSEQPGAGDVAVVDIGGATTDVHSVVAIDTEDDESARRVVAAMPVSRTVEGDLGMRSSASSTVAAGLHAGLLTRADSEELAVCARRGGSEPDWVPSTATERDSDGRLASVAVGLALRRHAGRQQVRFGPDGRLVEREGKDVREIDLLVGAGGVLRHNGFDFGTRVLAESCGDDLAGGWLLPRQPRITIDGDYVLAAAGLLAHEHPPAAYALLSGLLKG
jgi:uncharacterized protein (TIGR01319 family)